VPCNVCRKRKVKCNKESPCSNCVRLGLDCSYGEPSQNLKRQIDGTEDTAELSGRMVRLESLVRNLSKQPETSTTPQRFRHSREAFDNVLPNAPRITEAAKGRKNAILAPGKLCVTPDSSRHVVSSFWGGLFDEVCNSATILDQFGNKKLDREYQVFDR